MSFQKNSTKTKTTKPHHSIATDGNPASNLSMNCYTISGFGEELGIDFGEKVQSNVRVRKWFREKEKVLSRKYGSSTCEFREAITFSLWLADQGIREFLVLTPQVNFYAQPTLLRVVKKRRRKLIVADGDSYLPEANKYESNEGIWIYSDGETNGNGHAVGCECAVCRRGSS